MKSLEINWLETHLLRHLHVFIILLFISLVYLNIHIIILLTILTVLTRTMLAALYAWCITRTIFLITFSLFACAIYYLTIWFHCLHSNISLLTIKFIFTWLTSTFLWTKLSILKAFAIRFQTLGILAITYQRLIILSNILL